MIVEPKRPWKNYRKIQDIPTNKEYELSVPAFAVVISIVLCGIIIIAAVIRG